MFIFSTPVLIRHLWQLKTIVFLHWCVIHTIPLVNWEVASIILSVVKSKLFQFSSQTSYKNRLINGASCLSYCKCSGCLKMLAVKAGKTIDQPQQACQHCRPTCLVGPPALQAYGPCRFAYFVLYLPLKLRVCS